jgi:DNA polymerase-4
MKRLGIETGLDLKGRSLGSLQSDFGKLGSYYYWISRGIDDRPVQPDRVRKSIGAEDTFSKDVFSVEDAIQGLRPLIEKVWRYGAANEIRGRTVTLKVKYADFQQITRSRTAASAITSRTDFEQVATGLLAAIFPTRKGIRLLGISLSSLGDEADDDTQLRFNIDV